MNIFPSAQDAVERARRLSRYACALIDSGSCSLQPQLLARPFGREEMCEMLAGAVSDEDALKRTLRKLRQSVMLRTIARDLAGLADLHEVVSTVTALAEEATRAALSFYRTAFAQSYGHPRDSAGIEQSLHVIGMGKLGGGELNVSSDIDLIFAYPEEGETDGERKIETHDYFTRLARKLVSALSEITADGFVFRVDTRLRPYGDSGPLVASFDMLEDYFYTQGREWERYAWVKARVIAGDRADDLIALASPFVFRRHLDFSALESLRNLHAQIRQEVARRDVGDNIKLGPGGIREVEFVVQVFQLIRGGNDALLRARPTLEALVHLQKRGLLPTDAVTDLREAYIFLRNLEHRLQYLDDRQTQELPGAAEDRALVAESMGFSDYAAFESTLARHRTAVSRQFDAIFASAREKGEHPCAALWMRTVPEEEAMARLSALGFTEPEAALAQLTQFRSGSRYRRMSASGQARLDRLMPAVIGAAARGDNADATLARMSAIIEAIGRRESYLALLLEYPQALAALARLASASPWAADYLARHPMLLDELIAPQVMESPDWHRLRAHLRAELDAHAGNPERQMDLLRNFKHAQTFRLLTLDLAGGIALETLSDHLSDLASLLLGETLREAWMGVRTRHRETPRFAVIGYGKLGGKELGYASDLDIIFLYDDDDEAAAESYGRLAQRINAWLTSSTSAGVLYETDLRLRPNGIAGLLVSSVDAFRTYQFKQAWVWEHQALTRARAVAGDRDVGSAFEKIRVEVLRQPRERGALKAEVMAMRQKMREGHPNKSDLFDLKHDPGGIVDVEFIVQYLVLGYAAEHAELTGNIGNLALLKLAASLSLIPGTLADAAHAAYRDFRRKQHALRLQGQPYAREPRAAVDEGVTAVLALWDWVFNRDCV